MPGGLPLPPEEFSPLHRTVAQKETGANPAAATDRLCGLGQVSLSGPQFHQRSVKWGQWSKLDRIVRI